MKPLKINMNLIFFVLLTKILCVKLIECNHPLPEAASHGKQWMQQARHTMNDTESYISENIHGSEVSDAELLTVIADFLAMGHVDNIIAMFRQDTRYYTWVGNLLNDERFAVRLGLAVLFEYLAPERPEDVPLAIPSLKVQLENEKEWIRGEAVTLLGLIGTEEALGLVAGMVNDPSPQVVEIVNDLLEPE